MHSIMTLLKALKEKKLLWEKGECHRVDNQPFKRQERKS